jgi:hypothetical protein
MVSPDMTKRPACCREAGHHPSVMFLVTEADAVAIRAIYEQEGELSAAIELRRRFRGITDNAKAREHVRAIAGWKPLPPMPAKVVRLQTGKETASSM